MVNSKFLDAIVANTEIFSQHSEGEDHGRKYAQLTSRISRASLQTQILSLHAQTLPPTQMVEMITCIHTPMLMEGDTRTAMVRRTTEQTKATWIKLGAP